MSPRRLRGIATPASAGDELISLTLATALRMPDQPALIDAPGGVTTTYRELADRLLRVASSLTDAGLRRGDVVAVLGPNSSSWATFALGVMAAGGVVSGINPVLTPREIAHQITASGATLLAVTPELSAIVEQAGLDKLVREIVVLADETGGPHRALADLVRDGRADPRSPSPGDVALLPFSSGTSGLPKGVEVPARSLALAAASVRTALDLTTADVLMAVAPFCHIVGVSGVLAPALALGLPVVILPAPNLEAVLAAIEHHRVTLTVLTPPAIRALAEHPGVERHDLSSLRGLGCTAAPLAAELQMAASRRLGRPIFQGYGLTESIGAIALGPISDPRPGSCGMPAPGFEIRIVDAATRTDARPGAPGEIWARSPMLMRGYHGDPAATAAAMTVDGWFRTGDLGYLDPDGYLFIVDRLKDLIKVNASQVAPAELEAIVAEYPGVADAAVVGRPSPTTGECPVAYVVASVPIDADTLMAWVAERVAPFKRLHAVEFVDAIPRQLNGKIMRRLLEERGCVAA